MFGVEPQTNRVRRENLKDFLKLYYFVLPSFLKAFDINYLPVRSNKLWKGEPESGARANSKAEAGRQKFLQSLRHPVGDSWVGGRGPAISMKTWSSLLTDQQGLGILNKRGCFCPLQEQWKKNVRSRTLLKIMEKKPCQDKERGRQFKNAKWGWGTWLAESVK